MPRPRGRPTKLTPERADAFLKMFRATFAVEPACSAAEISRTTFNAWLKQGKRKKKGPYREFLDAVKKALAEFEGMHVANITRAAKGRPAKTITREIRHPDGRVETITERVAGVPRQWTASAWMLERRLTDRYAPMQRMRHEGDKERPVVFEMKLGTPAPPVAPPGPDTPPPDADA